MDDSILVERIRRGDERAFRMLVQRYQPSIVRTITGMLGDSGDVDDTVQDVFLRLHTALHTFRSDSALNTWLTRIAINRSLDVLRRRRRRRIFIPWDGTKYDRGVSEDEIPDRKLERSETQAMLRQAMDRLSSRHKSVIVLRMIEGYSTRETADILKIPYGTVLSRLDRALDRMRQLLDKPDMNFGGSREATILPGD